MLNRRGEGGHFNLIPELVVQTSKILPLVSEGFVDVLNQVKEVSFYLVCKAFIVYNVNSC